MHSTARNASWIDLVPALGAVWIAVQVVGTFLARWNHPYDLEWMEGGMLVHAFRLNEGLPLYSAPEADFVSFVYPPGYASVLALVSTFTGLDYGPGRMISIVSTLTAAALITALVARHGRSWLLGLCGAALYLGCFNASGGFYDLVRPDALSLALLAGSIAIGLEDRKGAPETAGLLLCASFLCKHNAAAYGFPLLAGIWVRSGPWAGFRFVAASAGPAIVFTSLLNWQSSGRFLDYIIRVPGSHPMVGARAFPGMPGELGNTLLPGVLVLGLWMIWRNTSRLPKFGLVVPVIALFGFGAWTLSAVSPKSTAPVEWWVLMGSLAPLCAACLAGLQVIGKGVYTKKLPWLWVYGGGVALTALVTAALMRGHHGGFLNVYMPLHWVTSLGVAMVAARVRLQIPRAWMVVASSAWMATNLAWVGLGLELERVKPTQADVDAGNHVVRQVKTLCDGPVHSPYAAWIPMQAGLGPSAHLIGIWDINHPDGPFFAGVDTYRKAATDHYWSCVIEGGRTPLKLGIDANYKRARTLVHDGPVLLPKTGWRVRPTSINVPR